MHSYCVLILLRFCACLCACDLFAYLRALILSLSVGPVATTAILIGAAVDQYDYEEGSPEYISVTVSLALLTGIIQLAMVSALGFVTK